MLLLRWVGHRRRKVLWGTESYLHLISRTDFYSVEVDSHNYEVNAGNECSGWFSRPWMFAWVCKHQFRTHLTGLETEKFSGVLCVWEWTFNVTSGEQYSTFEIEPSVRGEALTWFSLKYLQTPKQWKTGCLTVIPDIRHLLLNVFLNAFWWIFDMREIHLSSYCRHLCSCMWQHQVILF